VITTFTSEFAFDTQEPLPIDAASAGGAIKRVKDVIKDAESKAVSSLHIISQI
jgi:hypothetical protein